MHRYARPPNAVKCSALPPFLRSAFGSDEASGLKIPADFCERCRRPYASARPLPRWGLAPPRPCSGCYPLRLAARVASLLPLRPLRVAPLAASFPPPSPFSPLPLQAGGGSPPQNAIRIFSGAHQVPPTGVTCLGGLDFLRPPPAFIGRAHRRGVCLNWAMRVFLPYPPALSRGEGGAALRGFWVRFPCCSNKCFIFS